ncbi:hypothetical protein [Massilia sp. Root351]|uniref:hypothetical protein n=1 Tax=Massilia sp. Root351 TaxID=1736522 RepID=UPI0012F67F2B|nr:hypothetical protein [Massilia sp. Root351]
MELVSVPYVTNPAQLAEEHTYRCLGKLFVVFSSIEFKLALTLGNMFFGLNANRSSAIEKLTFQEKLENFVHTQMMDSHDEIHYQRCFDWYREADFIREVRNRFAHGRWAFLCNEPNIVHVAGYPDGKQHELRLSLEQLNDIVEAAMRVNEGIERIISNKDCPRPGFESSSMTSAQPTARDKYANG